MRVLLCNRPDALTAPGGDTVQMHETASALERLGAHVSVSLEPEPDPTEADVVHVFNLQRPGTALDQVRTAKAAGKPVALSTIYWDLRFAERGRDVLRYGSGPWLGRLASLSPWVAGGALDGLQAVRTARLGDAGQRARQVELLRLADVLLPNSIAELETVVAEFRYPMARAKTVVVPNGVDLARMSASSAPVPSDTSLALAALPPRFALEVARVEAIKGQLSLIQAMTSEPQVPLVFCGRADATPYVVACREAGRRRGNTFFVGAHPHDGLAGFYRRATVHVLPSLRESPGLVTLEAAAFGCNCVVAAHAPVQEYFGDEAWICDPEDPASLRAAVLAAWQAPPTALGQRVRDRYTWNHAAVATLGAYQRLLGGRIGHPSPAVQRCGS